MARLCGVAVVGTMIAVATVGSPFAASAGTFVVDSYSDVVDAAPGDGVCATSQARCTLRAALDEANASVGADVVELSSGTYSLSSAPSGPTVGGNLSVLDEVRISGRGASLTSIDGAGLASLFAVLGGDLSLVDLTITGGAAIEGGSQTCSAVHVYSGRAVLERARVSGNGAGRGALCSGSNSPPGASELVVRDSVIEDNDGAGVASCIGRITVLRSAILSNRGAGVWSDCPMSDFLDIADTRIASNTADGLSIADGAVLSLERSIVQDNEEAGVRVTANVWATVSESTVSGNRGGGVGAFYNGDPADLVVRDSLITANTSSIGPGGVQIRGYGVRATVENSTILANSGVGAGGIDVDLSNSFYSVEGPIAISSSSIVSNTGASAGLAIRLTPIYGSATVLVSLTRSIVALNTAGDGVPDCRMIGPGPEFTGSLLFTTGDNVVGDGTGCTIPFVASDLVGTTSTPIDPLVGPLDANGGATETLALRAGSPALDRYSCTGTDQRGASRPGPGSLLCDSGAFEAGDVDGDGVGDIADNCISESNSSQADTDLDGSGDACDADADGDAVADSVDNCPGVPNPDQANRDVDAFGDACDAFPDYADPALGQCSMDLVEATAALETCLVEEEVCFESLADPGRILETAQAQNSPPEAHLPVTAEIFIGGRFRVLVPTSTGSVGARIIETLPAFGGAPGVLFAAIVRLQGPTDLPDSPDLSTGDLVGTAHLPLPQSAAEVVADLNVPLDPGWYALVLGSGRFGASGGGALALNGAASEEASFLGRFGMSAPWIPIESSARLIVRGESGELLSCLGDLQQCQTAVIDGNGDVNADGVVNVLDAVLIRRSLANLPPP